MLNPWQSDCICFPDQFDKVPAVITVCPYISADPYSPLSTPITSSWPLSPRIQTPSLSCHPLLTPLLLQVSSSNVRTELSATNSTLLTEISLIFTRIALGDSGTYQAEIVFPDRTSKHNFFVNVNKLPAPFRVLESYVNYNVVIGFVHYITKKRGSRFFRQSNVEIIEFGKYRDEYVSYNYFDEIIFRD